MKYTVGSGSQHWTLRLNAEKTEVTALATEPQNMSIKINWDRAE